MTLLTLLSGTGTTSGPVYTGLLPVAARRRIEALDAQTREAMYIPSLITLPDGSGYLLFGDGSRVMWGAGDTGTAGQVRRRIDSLNVTKREGVTNNEPAQVKRKVETLKVDRSG